LTWKGNYDLSITSAITQIYDGRNNYYGLDAVTWSVQTIEQTSNRYSGDYGKFAVVVSTSGDHYYHGTSVEARWLGIGSRTRNVYTP